MSNREQIIKLLDSIPDYKIGYVLAYVQGVTADEEADNLFCESLAQSYLADTEAQADEGIPLEQCKKEWGIA